jgi:hypothetical protein
MLWNYQNSISYYHYRYSNLTELSSRFPCAQCTTSTKQQSLYQATKHWEQIQHEEQLLISGIGLWLFVAALLLVIKFLVKDLQFKLSSWQIYFCIIGHVLYSIIATAPMLNSDASPLNSYLSSTIIFCAPLPLIRILTNSNKTPMKKLGIVGLLLTTLLFELIYAFAFMFFNSPAASFG